MEGLSSLRKLFESVTERICAPFKTGCDPDSSKCKKIESRLPTYKLPDVFELRDGSRAGDMKAWYEKRRLEILELFRTHVYGHGPSTKLKMVVSDISIDENAMGGSATKKEIRIMLAGRPEDSSITLLLYLPNKLRNQSKKAPVFLGLNFFGNHTIHKDPGISVTKSWIPKNRITKGKPPELLRGIQSTSWPVEFILNHGYGLATVYCGDIVPDREDGLYLAGMKLFGEGEATRSASDSWGAIAGWAWGLSRAKDYLDQDLDIDTDRVILMGHSRLGKAALWAGAQDERFAIVISNESGCGGAALSRRKIGESVAEINSSFPYWFCDNFKNFNNREEFLPIDQHELIALVAPRPVYIASAQMDLHADPMGEFLATKHASPVYKLLGTCGLPTEKLPSVNAPIMGTMGYHMRKGRHGILLYDWAQFIIFADLHIKN